MAVDKKGKKSSATDPVTVGFVGGTVGAAFMNGMYYYRELPLDKGKGKKAVGNRQVGSGGGGREWRMSDAEFPMLNGREDMASKTMPCHPDLGRFIFKTAGTVGGRLATTDQKDDFNRAYRTLNFEYRREERTRLSEDAKPCHPDRKYKRALGFRL